MTFLFAQVNEEFQQALLEKAEVTPLDIAFAGKLTENASKILHLGKLFVSFCCRSFTEQHCYDTFPHFKILLHDKLDLCLNFALIFALISR